MGKLIVLEGTDCSGKDTQSKILTEKLNKLGIKTINISFPMYNSPTGRIIGGPLLGKKEYGECWFDEGPINVDPKISCLLYAADRKYNFNLIKKYLDDDYYVILDRYVSSNMAHQGSKIENNDERFNFFRWIDKLEYWLLELPKADITIYLHVPFKYTKELMSNRNDIDLVEKNDEHLIRTESVYIELAELYNWKVVNCIDRNLNKLKTIDTINDEIINIILEK